MPLSRGLDGPKRLISRVIARIRFNTLDYIQRFGASLFRSARPPVAGVLMNGWGNRVEGRRECDASGVALISTPATGGRALRKRRTLATGGAGVTEEKSSARCRNGRRPMGTRRRAAKALHGSDWPERSAPFPPVPLSRGSRGRNRNAATACRESRGPREDVSTAT